MRPRDAAHALAGAREARDAQARGRHDARPRRSHQPAPRTARPAMLAGAGGVDEFEEFRGITLRARDRREALRLVVVPGELQHAATVPDQVIAVVLQRAEVLQRVQEGAARDAGVERVAQVGDRAHEAHGRRAALGARVDERHVPVARGEPLGGERAREARAHDERGALRGSCPARARASRRDPTSISRLAAKPARFSTRNPAPARAARTPPATVQVASVAPGAASRASSRTISGDQRRGLRAGANPSRK